jgi:hypothetical protein
MDSNQALNFVDILFTKYGTYVTLFFGVIAYFIKRAYDYKSKKIEINHSIFQQHRIDSVNRFFINYNAAKAMWRELPHYDVIENVTSAKDLDNKVQPVMRDLRLSMLELRFYFEPKTYALFEEIENGLNKIYNTVGTLRGDYGKRENKIARGNKLSFSMDENFRANDKLIGQLCDLIRENYKMSL